MYKKYMTRCFSKKGFFLTLFCLSIICLLFGTSLYAADSVKDDLKLNASVSADDSAPVSFPVKYNSQRFLANTLDYGHIAFRSGKHDVPAWNAHASCPKHCSSVTTDHSTSEAIQVSARVANVSNKGSFYLRC